MSGRIAHTKNIPSNPIVVYHPYTWKHYSQYNNNILQWNSWFSMSINYTFVNILVVVRKSKFNLLIFIWMFIRVVIPPIKIGGFRIIDVNNAYLGLCGLLSMRNNLRNSRIYLQILLILILKIFIFTRIRTICSQNLRISDYWYKRNFQNCGFPILFLRNLLLYLFQ